MSNQERLEIVEVSLMCQNPECNNIHHEVTSDLFASIYNIVCAKCGYRGFKLLSCKNLLGEQTPTKFSFE